MAMTGTGPRMLHLVPLLLAAAVAGCGGGQADDGSGKTPSDVPSSMTVSSTAFVDGGQIPAAFTCDGADDSPPLAWTGMPETSEFAALVVDDPDAPAGTYVHWVVLDIPRGVTSLSTSEVPAGAVQAENSAGQASYTGPCPPSGTHHYRFTVYALPSATGLPEGVPLDEALAAVDAAAEAQGRLVGTYGR